eukprot:CAMPEP_0196659646 /NCGR_PEP_ID=MMETSP1086-20130531/36008_1 /TAXON_ID=77921 /ORGANISM="Cyanoptyche  gloeocystis , Strain SAG4.97" /LENGTH=399 /DNA_ID=CAMNT_0041993705 /DNA_START=179 /DNA_END=1375 /DNA_ORIENTATION=+
MILNPFDFYERQRYYGPMSWNAVGGKFMVFTAGPELTRKIFQNAAGTLRLWLIFGAKRVLGPKTIAFLHGPEHKELRRQLMPLFVRKALAVYLPHQERTIRKHINNWFKIQEAFEVRPMVRDLNMETSTAVFVGSYLDDSKFDKFVNLYFQINEGMLCWPIMFPGTTLWKAVKAREAVIIMLEECARRSIKRMEAGGEPNCLLDFWMKGQHEEYLETGKQPLHSSVTEIAFTVLDFIFASQDASTSSLVWMTQFLADYPDVLAKVREEQARLRPNKEPLTEEILQEMIFTRQVVKETLRFRAPAIMVPHIAVEDTKIDDKYIIPKNSIILPSIWCAAFEGFKDAERFDPERFSPERAEDVKYSKNYLVFGTGPHACLGREYAINHLTAFCAILSTTAEW